ncbi:MAG: hypothetical protein SOT38_08005, partial [Oscillospiraceae bacterium]|nr:hypothetical protein [Oscillospiraceae bacterium]
MKSINLGKISHTTISVLLILVLLVTSLPLTSMNTSAEAVSQTKYDNISDFQNARWTEIQNKVFGQNYTSVQSADVIKDLPVQQGNEIFNWTDTSHMQGYDNDGNEIDGGLQKYGTTTVTDMSYTTVTEKYVGNYTDYLGKNNTVSSTVKYDRVYDVYTADQFAYILKQEVAKYNVKINLCADIDMGGENDRQFSTGASLKSIFFLEGNGHTIYNTKIYGTSNATGIFTTISSGGRLIVNNLGIQSTMLLHVNRGGEGSAGYFFGYRYGAASFSNVHMRQSFFQQNSTAVNEGVAFLGGKANSSYSMFVDNCSVSNGYIYGKGHVGALFSCVGYLSSSKVKYDVEFPDNPVTFIFDGSTIYPSMFNNSYSVDCEMFSTGADSGAFISCGKGIIATNCYTNNTMYSNYNTGAFVGRLLHEPNSRIYDGNGKLSIIACFRNCYTAGIVEGKVAMGGFTGFECGNRAWNAVEGYANTAQTTAGTSVYLNCYSTTMVGMDYTGKYCGGFSGFDDNYSAMGTTVKTQDGTVINNAYGTIYANCYAAGEVGNILTQTDTEKSVAYDKDFYTGGYYRTTQNMDNYYPSGGFIGALNLDSYCMSTNRISGSNNTFGYFYNCYYDMQTTGMHEMAIGLAYAETCRDDTSGQNARKGINANSKVVHKDANGNETPFSVIGITGVYTEKSYTKNVAGLTGLPVEYKDSSGNVLSRMSMGSETAVDSENTDVWQYNQG